MSKEKSTPIEQEDHDLYIQALEIVVKNGKASCSFLQRSLKIGYSRAARLLDLLEEAKVVAPQDGAKPREVLIKRVTKAFRDKYTQDKKEDTNRSNMGRKKNLIAAAETLIPTEEPILNGDFEEERELDEWDEEIDTIPEGLTRDEERFCRAYVSATEFYGNGTQSYIEAYSVMIVRGTQEKLEKGKRKKMTIESVRASASKLLTNLNILNRINELLEDGGFNDEFIDKQLKFLITQNADPRVKLGAMQEYNKLKQRIHEKSTMVHQFSNEDVSDEELQRRIAEKQKFFNKK